MNENNQIKNKESSDVFLDYKTLLNDMINIKNKYVKDVNLTDLSNEFYKIYSELLKHKDEEEYITQLDNMINHNKLRFFYRIKKVKELIFNLEEHKMLLAFKITLLTQIKSNLYNDICKIFTNNTEDISTEKVINDYRLLKNYHTYINAFSSFPESIEDRNEYIQDSTMDRYGSSKWIDMWYFETKNEICDRLNQLNIFFGSVILSRFGIKKKQRDKINMMAYRKIQKYYTKMINKIKDEIQHYMQSCEIYLEVEQSYITCLITHDLEIDLEKFEIIIEE